GGTEGFAEDYALLAAGLLDLYELTFDAHWLRWAARVQAKMDALFWDEVEGGWFNSVAGATDVVLRLKEDSDGAEPSPSSIAAANLLRLSAIFHDDGARARAVRAIEAFQARWLQMPQALPEMLCAVERALEPPRQAVLAGDPAAADFQALAAVVREGPGPRRALVQAGPELPWTVPMIPRDGRATVYVCENFRCQAPVSDPAELRRLLV
ncbi:MAG: thioredoxin domain-containing protein, partial [Verrucomicrobiota bacterium]